MNYTTNTTQYAIPGVTSYTHAKTRPKNSASYVNFTTLTPQTKQVNPEHFTYKNQWANNELPQYEENGNNNNSAVPSLDLNPLIAAQRLEKFSQITPTLTKTNLSTLVMAA